MENLCTAKELRKLNQMISEIDAVYHEAAWKLGLSDSAMQVLYGLCDLGDGCLLSDIVRLSGISKQTINSALRKLEKEEILWLEDLNGRRKRVWLTEKGKGLTEETVHHIIRMENEILGGWTAEDRNRYLDLTEKYLMEMKERVREMEEKGK